MTIKIILLSVLYSVAIQITAQPSEIPSMVKSLWSQNEPFNDDCPIIKGERSLTGCGATAVAQILNYHKRPSAGFGKVTYDMVDMDFSKHPIDWVNMLDNYKNVSKGVETQAVANLMYVVGSAMKMHYRERKSGSSPYYYASMLWGLQHHLHFSPRSRYRRRLFYSTAEWIEMLNNELENNRPVFYRGDHSEPDTTTLWGHIFVIDGRDGIGNYHFNFGHASASQNKLASLSIINQGEGTWPGVYGVCYHHRQAMITEFEPIEGLDDDDFDKTAIILESPMVLANDPYAKTVQAEKNVQASFQIRYACFVGGDMQYSLGFYQGERLCETSGTIRPSSLSDGGRALIVNRSFTLPSSLADGEYEMSVVSRDDEDSPWVRGWDNAPNCVPVSVKKGIFTFHMPKYHTLETNLYLENSIQEIDGGRTGGKTFELTICNPSDNNFEDSLRISITAKGKTAHSYQRTSIYDGQKITYRYFISDKIADFSGQYSVEAYYRETNGENGVHWVSLNEYGAGIRQVTATSAKSIEIWSTEGVLMKRLAKGYYEQDYSRLLSELPKGIYIIRDKNGSRKFTKRR